MATKAEKNATIAATWVKNGFTFPMINQIIKHTNRDGWYFTNAWCISIGNVWQAIDTYTFRRELGNDVNDEFYLGKKLQKAGVKIIDHGDWIIFVGNDYPKN